MKTHAPQLAAPLMIALAVGIAGAAPHFSTLEINRGRAMLAGFSPPSSLFFYLDMATDTPDPASGTYSIDMPPPGSPCEVYIEGGFTFDINSDNTADLELAIDRTMIAAQFDPANFRSAWATPHSIELGDVEFDLAPLGLTFDLALSDVTLTIVAGDIDNDAPAGALGPDAFIVFELSAEIELPGDVVDRVARDLFGQDGIFNARYNADLTFHFIPSPMTLALLPLAAASRRRR